MSEHDTEPIRGLPAALPPGERCSGRARRTGARWRRRAFHVRKVAIYFGAARSPGVVVVRARRTANRRRRVGVGAAVAAAAGLAAVGHRWLFIAWLYARTTVYTITNRRVVMRFGVALPMTLNLPFRIDRRRRR